MAGLTSNPTNLQSTKHTHLRSGRIEARGCEATRGGARRRGNRKTIARVVHNMKTVNAEKLNIDNNILT